MCRTARSCGSRPDRADWISDRTWRDLERAAYTVGADSNRIGLRLHGPPVERARRRELASEGIVLGAVQLRPGESVEVRVQSSEGLSAGASAGSSKE